MEDPVQEIALVLVEAEPWPWMTEMKAEKTILTLTCDMCGNEKIVDLKWKRTEKFQFTVKCSCEKIFTFEEVEAGTDLDKVQTQFRVHGGVSISSYDARNHFTAKLFDHAVRIRTDDKGVWIMPKSKYLAIENQVLSRSETNLFKVLSLSETSDEEEEEIPQGLLRWQNLIRQKNRSRTVFLVVKGLGSYCTTFEWAWADIAQHLNVLLFSF
ncbi:hypothetical protein LXL04_007656 [Taraxacum kok-saghyz]